FNRLFTFFADNMAFIINYDHCLCCGSAAISKVFTCKDFAVSKEQFEIWKCGTCTFRFTQNVPAANYIGPYYQSSAYISHSDTKKGLVNNLYHLVRSFTLRAKQKLITRVTGLSEGVLLDIGAGTGAFANKMTRSNWNVTALEPDEFAREKALSNYKVELNELAALNDLVGETFDAITLWHVLEHVHDLNEYLEKFLEILKPEGKLVVAVPNYTSYDASYYKEYWAAYDVPRHLYHFSPKSMQVLLDKKGFVLETIEPMWFDSFYVSMLSEKYRRDKQNFINAIWIGLISNLKARSDREKCSSVIYVIRKKG
ncbi:MAG: class I SAM-dependent methyltransferase, partial [Segetibacter sp.]